MAAPGADVAEDEEGRGARVPAFPSIGAAGFFADGVELEPVHCLLDVEIVRAGLGFDLEPGWKSPERADGGGLMVGHRRRIRRRRSELVERDKTHEL